MEYNDRLGIILQLTSWSIMTQSGQLAKPPASQYLAYTLYSLKREALDILSSLALQAGYQAVRLR